MPLPADVWQMYRPAPPGNGNMGSQHPVVAATTTTTKQDSSVPNDDDVSHLQDLSSDEWDAYCCMAVDMVEHDHAANKHGTKQWDTQPGACPSTTESCAAVAALCKAAQQPQEPCAAACDNQTLYPESWPVCHAPPGQDDCDEDQACFQLLDAFERGRLHNYHVPGLLMD